MMPRKSKETQWSRFLFVVSFENALMLLLLEHHIYRFDDSNFRMRFAINNDFVLHIFGAGNVKILCLGWAIVPTAVPRCDPVSIFLRGQSKRAASKRLPINV